MTVEHVVVVVPAADEEAHIVACLDTLERARARLTRKTAGSVRTDVIVVLDGCRDGTAQLVADYSDLTVLKTEVRNVGAARCVGTEHALASIASAERALLASTDADSCVPKDWLVQLVGLANHGADVIVGTVRPDGDLHSSARQLWRRIHCEFEGHPYVHGANLAIRASTYIDAGGWQPLVSGEDVDLVARAAARGARVLRTATTPVLTSGRLSGRAPAGFATYLKEMCATAAPESS